jgi:hypothetical protein
VPPVTGRTRQAPGGGRIVEVEPGRLPGWLMRFAERHGGADVRDAGLSEIVVMGGDGATAALVMPFAATQVTRDESVPREPVEALLAHIAAVGDLAAIVVRERAFSVGVCRAGEVLTSSTDTRYVQSRTAAGGWSQQRYARRRGNQRRDSYRAAADAAHRVFAAHPEPFDGLIAAGDRAAIDAVLDDPRLGALAALPRRVFPDVGEPRRAVLDEVAARALTVEITIRDVDATSGR